MDPREDQQTLDADGNVVREPNTRDDDEKPSSIEVAAPVDDDREPNTKNTPE